MKAIDGFLGSRNEAVVQVLLVAGCLVLLTHLANRTVWRWDLTEDRRYTLSEASRQIASELHDPVTVRAYFSADLPPQLAQAKDEFRNFLEEFRARAGGDLEYTFINPNADEAAEMEAQQMGIQPVVIDVRERDQIVQKRAYLGAVFSYGEKQEVVPFLQPGASLEYTIAGTIKRLSREDKPKVGVLQGHGEPSLQAMQQLVDELRRQYEVAPVSGIDTAGVPPDVDVLLVIRPREELDDATLLALDQYLMQGGNAVFAVDRVDVDLRFGNAQPLETGIETLLEDYGVSVRPNLIRDQSSSVVQVRQQRGPFSFVNQIQYPYLPLVTQFAGHPISEGLEAAIFQFASALDVSRIDTSRQKVVVLATSSERSGTATGPFYNIDPMQEWQPSDFVQASLPMAALVEGRFTSSFADSDTLEVTHTESRETKFVVIGDGDLVVNGEGQMAQLLPDDNISLVVNSVDYLADETGLMALRTKGVTNRPLALVSEGAKTVIKYLNLLFPVALVLAYGFLRYRRNRVRRRRWQEVGV